MSAGSGNGSMPMNWRKRADWLRRWLGTAFGFALFGGAGLLLAVLLLPYTLVSTAGNLRRQRQARRMVAASWRFFVRYLAWAGVLSYELHGFERLGRPGQLVLPNHPSLLDVLFVVAHVPEINCIVKQDLLRNPVMISPIKSCGYLPNDESETLLEAVDDTLRGGQCLLVFPEGTRTGWDGQVRLHRGVVSMGLRSATVITPVRIRMQPPNFKKNQPWYTIPSLKIHYHISVGEDILPQTWLAEKPLPIASRRLNQYLEDYFNQEPTL